MLNWDSDDIHKPDSSVFQSKHYIFCGLKTRTSAYKSSHGTPVFNSLDKASKTRIKSKELNTDPWCTPTFTPNSSLSWLLIRTRLFAPIYMLWTTWTAHSSTPSFLIAHQITLRGTRSKAFSKLTKTKKIGFWTTTYFSCISGISTKNEAKLHFINIHHLSDSSF